MSLNMGDALKSQKKGLKMNVTKMGKCTANIESSCVAETICETRPAGRDFGKSLRGSNSAHPCVPTRTHSETN